MIAVADELAGAAELVMGKASGVPAALIRGYRVPAGDGSARELVMPPGAGSVPRQRDDPGRAGAGEHLAVGRRGAPSPRSASARPRRGASRSRRAARRASAAGRSRPPCGRGGRPRAGSRPPPSRSGSRARPRRARARTSSAGVHGEARTPGTALDRAGVDAQAVVPLRPADEARVVGVVDEALVARRGVLGRLDRDGRGNVDRKLGRLRLGDEPPRRRGSRRDRRRERPRARGRAVAAGAASPRPRRRAARRRGRTRSRRSPSPAGRCSGRDDHRPSVSSICPYGGRGSV